MLSFFAWVKGSIEFVNLFSHIKWVLLGMTKVIEKASKLYLKNELRDEFDILDLVWDA